MRKYENVDIIATLGAVVELNTEHYKSDFKYDADMFKEAAINPDGENNRLLWLSRHSGTECFPERDAYIIETHAHTAWIYHAEGNGDSLRAYAVEITGLDNGRVIGNLTELDYRQHAAEVKKAAVPCVAVFMKFKSGKEMCMPYDVFSRNSEGLYYKYGELDYQRREPENEKDLQAMINISRAKRDKESRPAQFKVNANNAKQPSIKEKIAASRQELDRECNAAPPLAATKPNRAGLEV